MSYCGIQVILGRLSRFDEQSNKPISGKAGEYFDKQFAKCGIDRSNLSISTAFVWNSKQRYIPDNTKAILTLGPEALVLFNTNTNLGEQRGSPFDYGGIPVISTFAPQDTNDIQDFEGTYHGDSDEDDINDKTFNKGHGVTARRNYKFWYTRDIAKCIRISQTGLDVPQFEPLLFPDIDDIYQTLTQFKNCYLHIDIETDPDTLDITVFSFCYESLDGQILTPVYTVPLRRYSYECAYEQPWKIWKALAIAFRDNIVVTHNGHQYDLFVFTYKYRIPFPIRNWDTMIGQHRCFPEAEKSLGHVISLYTDFPFHKNDGIFKPFNREQEMRLWNYNAKDVHRMIYVRQAQETYARKIGALNSILEANESIEVYLTETFTGIRRNNSEAEIIMHENNHRITQLNRILSCLVGNNYNPKYDPITNPVKLNTGSNKQMRQYLFNDKASGGLGLQPFAYGKINKKTGKAAPKADEKSLLKLQVKHNIPSLNVIMELRRLKKQTSSLDISFWNPYGLCSSVNKVESDEENESED